MSSSHPAPPGDARQRKLDDLFGDEPHLSPTMKARRLTDAQLQPPATTSDSGQRTPAATRASVLDQAPQISDEETAALWSRRVESERLRSSNGFGPILDSEPEAAAFVPALKLVNTTAAAGAWHEAPAAPAPAAWTRLELPDAIAAIPMKQAAALLRADLPEDTAVSSLSPLSHFRTNVLARWFSHLPKRERDGEVEES